MTVVFTPSRRLWVATVLLVSASSAAFAQSEHAPGMEIRFSTFFRHPVAAGGLEIGEALRSADGYQVRLVGFMVQQEQPRPGRFLLTPRPLRMSEHADGDADDLPPATVSVLLDAAQRDRIVVHRDGLIALTGRLEVGRHEESDGRVSWVRLQLPPDATADTAGASRSLPHKH